MKQYILLKDLPSCKAGEVFTHDFDLEWYNSSLGRETAFPAKYVENNPEWFKPVVEYTVLPNEYIVDFTGHWEEISKIQSPLPNTLRGFRFVKFPEQPNGDWNLPVIPYEEWILKYKQYTEKDMRECFNQSKYLLRKYFHERTVTPHIKEPEFEDFLKIMPNNHFTI